jgi:hypothetical protein
MHLFGCAVHLACLYLNEPTVFGSFRCSNLRELHLEDLERQFSSRALLMIGKLCPSLHTLVLPGILEHPDEVIEPIITYLPQLR